MKQTLAVKLAPTPDQHAALLATMERVNVCCDWLAAVAFRERIANKIELQKLTYYDARERFGLSSQLTIRAIAKTIEAYKRDKTIRPQFKPHGAIAYDQRIMSWRGIEAVSLLTLSGRVVVPIRFGDYQRERLDRARGQADLVYRDGVFFLYCTLDVPEPTPLEAEAYVGVDLGVVNLAVTDDGETFSGDGVEMVRRRYTRRRRELQPQHTKSARKRLRKIRRGESGFKKNENHVISKRIVEKAKDTGRGIAIENLEGISGRVTVRKAQRSRMKGWAFSQLRIFLEYKALASGVPVALVDPAYTSQQCSGCGYTARNNRRSRDAFVCRHCDLSLLADVNAARNIRNRAEVVQPLVGHGDGGPRNPPECTDKPRGFSPCGS